PYESVHGLWRFAMRIGSVERNPLAVETGIRNACAQMGYPIKKHFVSARIEGRRTVGGFILKPVKERKINSFPSVPRHLDGHLVRPSLLKVFACAIDASAMRRPWHTKH